MFYACFTLIGSWEGGENFKVGIFLNKNLLGQGYTKKKTFFIDLMLYSTIVNACTCLNSKNTTCFHLLYTCKGGTITLGPTGQNTKIKTKLK